MCGIVGVLAQGPAAPIIVEALRRLEYRGYDSAGVATVEGARLDRRRAPGKLSALRERLAAAPLAGRSGIGHTRWATHGAPTEANAHPHVAAPVAVVHNGVIENHRALRAELEAAGRSFDSDTDTETVVQLCALHLARGLAPFDAVQATLSRLQGSWALVFLFEGEDDLLICARHGSPLVIGLGAGETFVGSDALALAAMTDRIVHLEDGDRAMARRGGVRVLDAAGLPVERPARLVETTAALAGKAGRRHFMEKEMHEQPTTVARAVAAGLATGGAIAAAARRLDWAGADRLTLIGCGTAHHAGHVARGWFESLARLPVEIEVASEYRYRQPPRTPHGLACFVSQSGETADTLAALRWAKAEGLPTLAVVNVETSAMAREADAHAPILAGPEIGVASTKAFTGQLAALAAAALIAADARGTLSPAALARLRAELGGVPALIAATLACEPVLAELGVELAGASDVLFLGRGAMHPIALEAALKFKELTYAHAAGHAAGELKHGTIALVDPTRPAVGFAPCDALFDKTLSNLSEVAARGGPVTVLTDARGAERAEGLGRVVTLPQAEGMAAPFVHAVAAQLIAYHAALARGLDIDMPRNLAKSVTVE